VAVCELGSHRARRRTRIHRGLGGQQAAVGPGGHARHPLLYRHARGVDLTPAGESLLHHARSVLFSLEKMQGELSEYAEGVRGHVRIHANISAIVQFLPGDLGVFTPAHEQVKIDLEERVSTEIIRAVHEGAADIGICNRRRAGELQACRLPARPAGAVVPTGHPLARCGAV
jgi:DNA-binding transcriptional LysR family regulator